MLKRFSCFVYLFAFCFVFYVPFVLTVGWLVCLFDHSLVDWFVGGFVSLVQLFVHSFIRLSEWSKVEFGE